MLTLTITLILCVFDVLTIRMSFDVVYNNVGLAKIKYYIILVSKKINIINNSILIYIYLVSITIF